MPGAVRSGVLVRWWESLVVLYEVRLLVVRQLQVGSSEDLILLCPALAAGFSSP